MKVRDVMRRDLTTVQEDEDLALALQMMLWRRIRHLPVVKDGRIVGLLTERDILRQRDASAPYAVFGTVGDAMQRPPKTIEPDTDIAEAAKRLSDYKIGCLPVVERGDLVGIVTTNDLLQVMAKHPAPPDDVGLLDAEAVMVTDVIAVMSDEDLVDAAATMVQHGVRHLPVVDGLKRVVGILSDRDIRQLVGNPLDALGGAKTSARLRQLKVSDAMTPEPHTFTSDQSVSRIAAALINDRIGAVPIVDEEDRLLGMISYVDILRCVVNPEEEHRAAKP